MDAVILFFGKATFEEIETDTVHFGFSNGNVTRGDTQFYLARYSENDYLSEYSPTEQKEIIALLNVTPKSRFAVESRHGPDARFALEVVSHLMLRYKLALLDDDFGNYWSPQEVMNEFVSTEQGDIYSLRHKNGKQRQDSSE